MAEQRIMLVQPFSQRASLTQLELPALLASARPV